MKRQSVLLQGQPVGRIKAGWLLFKETWRFLMLDKELLWVPIITSLLNILLFGTVISLVVLALLGGSQGLAENDWFVYGFVFSVYVIGAFTLALAQAATAHTVYIRVHGGNATLGESLKVAFSHWFSLLIWSLITATVGVVLRWLADRSKLLGWIVIMLIGSAWSVLTYFVVPAMVIGKKSAFASIGDSTRTFKDTWGETLVSNISYGLIFLFLHLAAIFSVGGIAIAFMSVGFDNVAIAIILLLVPWFIIMAIISSAMNSVLRTLLYVYAREHVVPQNFNQELLEKMLARKETDTPPTPLPDLPAAVPQPSSN